MKRVAVIGAGVAGVATAAALHDAGWHVTLIESGPDICTGASGNAAGAFHAHISRDDAPISRLTRLGVAATLASLEQLTDRGLLRKGLDWASDGHYQLCDSPADEDKTRETFKRLPHLHEKIRWATPQEIGKDLGWQPAHGGLFFLDAGWVKPRAWCTALLSDKQIALLTHTHVSSMELQADGPVSLTLQQQDGASDTQTFDRVVIAAAYNSLQLYGQPCVQSHCVKGQVSLVRAPAPLPRVVSGAAYAIGLDDATWLIGATYERPATNTDVTQEAHGLNLGKLQTAFPGLPPLQVVDGRSALRTMWPDRMPAIGPAIDNTGALLDSVWYATGYGSRGLTWAALAAQTIAALWAGQNPPLDQDLLAAVLPGRFFSRASNSKPTLPSFPSTR